MKEYSTKQIRNVVLLSHGGAGKTSLSEAALFASGAVNRLGKVEAGTTVSDFEPEEVKRKISISLSLLPCEWKGFKINLVDVPGYTDFAGELRSALRVVESAVVVVSGRSGLKVGTNQAWKYCEKAGLSRLIFVNKMDRENADFERVVGQIQSKYGMACVPIQMPIGAFETFKGVIDILKMKAYAGTPMKEIPFPEELRDKATKLRDAAIENIAESDDNLMEKYLGGEEISDDEIFACLKKNVAEGKLFPILAGCATTGEGSELLLDAITEYLPDPTMRDIQYAEGSAKDADTFAALVFKTAADPYVGKLTYFRVYSGEILSNTQVYNVTQSAVERVGQLYSIHGKVQQPEAKIVAGDIGAVAKLSVTTTNDTLGTQEKPVKLAAIEYPAPVYSVAVYPKTKADLDKMGGAIARIVEEDPTLTQVRDAETGEVVLSGMGDTQLDVAAEKMQRKFGVSVELQVPKVAYRETITIPSKAEYKHKKQTGGHGQYGHVLLELNPLPRGSENTFENKVVGGAIPKNYIPAVEKGVFDGLKEGVLAGFPIVDVNVAVYDGSYHPVDSSEICFKIAAAQALKKGLQDARPIILEPVMLVKIEIPNDFTGEILSDLNTKRARVHGMNPVDDINYIEAEVPMGEMLKYAIDLKSITQGQGTFSMTFDHYEEVPAFNAQQLIEAHKAEASSETQN